MTEFIPETYEYIQAKRSLSYESESVKYTEGQHTALEYFFKNVPIGKWILDCACGDGVGLKWFNDHGYKSVVGVDLSQDKIDRAKVINPNAFCYDFRKLDERFSNSTFDIVWSSHSLEHADKPLEVLKQFHDVIAKNGQLFLIIPFPDTGPMDVHCGQVDLQSNKSDPSGVLAVIVQAGFNIEDWKLDTFRENEIWIKAIKV